MGSGSNAIVVGATADVHGCGYVNVKIGISTELFCAVAEAMMAANADEAIKAFGQTLKDGIVNQRPLKPLRDMTEESLRAAVDAAFLKRAIAGR